MSSIDLGVRFSGTIYTEKRCIDVKVFPPSKKRVVILDRFTAEVLRVINIYDSGPHRIELRKCGEYVLVIAVDDSGLYNAEVYDYVKPKEVVIEKVVREQ